MKAPSTTIVAAGKWGFASALVLGIVAIFFPEIYERVPPGFEGALAVGIGTIIGYSTKEKRYEMRERKAGAKG